MAEEKRQFIDDQRRRNADEGKFGQGKRRFGLGLIHEKLALTQGFNHCDEHLGDEPREAARASFCAFHMLASSSLGQRIAQ